MTKFKLSSPSDSSVWETYLLRHSINMDPEYQREGDIWNVEKQQLLIDTIINGFDIPKIYLHRFARPIKSGSKVYEYAVVDGKQRLSAMWSFIRGEFCIADDYVHIADSSQKLAGLSYSELGVKYPNIKTRFDSRTLSIVQIETDDLELIEDMFSRLNEAVPLNSAEKRNAWAGPLPPAVRTVAGHEFFRRRLPFENRRYRHYDIAAKMLLMQHKQGIADTKKMYVDRFFEDFKEKSSKAKVAQFVKGAVGILDRMDSVFKNDDALLKSVGMLMIYYLLFQAAEKASPAVQISRSRLMQFETMRIENRVLAAANSTKADYDLLEFDRFAQSPNDAIAMRFRLGVIDDKLFSGGLGFHGKAIS